MSPITILTAVLGKAIAASPPPSGTWILATGVWNDAGLWEDTATWIG